MNCAELRDFYELYALGLLELGESAEIDAHLARSCPDCRLGVRKALVLNSMIATMVPEAKPDKKLKNRIMASVGHKKQGINWWPAFGVVTAGLVVSMAGFWMRDRQGRSELADARKTILQQDAQIQQTRQMLTFLNAPETRLVGFDQGQPKPRGNVFVNPRAGVLLIASNLPELESGKTYQMWLIPKSGAAPKPAGLFRRDTVGGAVHFLNEPVDIAATAAFAVSVEPAAGSQAPTTTPIIVAPVGP